MKRKILRTCRNLENYKILLGLFKSIQDFYNFESEAQLNASQKDNDRSSSMPGRYRVQHFLKDRRPRAQVI